jgi:hypothetical protein
MKVRAEDKYYIKDTRTTAVVTRTFEADTLSAAQAEADAAFGSLGFSLSTLKSASVRPILPREVPAAAA